MKKLILSLCLGASPVLAEAPKVVTDIVPVHALTSLVMEGVGQPELIIPLNASPHNFAMRPTQAAALSQADVVIWIGHGLTPWMEGPIERLAPQATVLELMEAEGVNLLPYRTGTLFEAHDHGSHGDHDDHSDLEGHDDHDKHDGHDDHAEEGHDDHDHDAHAEEGHGEHDDHDKHDGHDDHAEEGHDDHDHEAHADKDHDKHDDHDADHGKDEHADHDADHAKDEDGHAGHDHAAAGGFDPHVWLDPENGARFLDVIAAQLSAVDPENAAVYAANAAKGRAEIDAAETHINDVLADARGKAFIVLHDGFHYFEHHFEIESLGAISAGDAVSPGAARVAALRAALPESGLKCAFSEPQVNGRIIDTVIEGMRVETAILDPLGADLAMGPTLYPALLRDMGDAMAECLTR